MGIQNKCFKWVSKLFLKVVFEIEKKEKTLRIIDQLDGDDPRNFLMVTTH